MYEFLWEHSAEIYSICVDASLFPSLLTLCLIVFTRLSIPRPIFLSHLTLFSKVVNSS